MERLLDYFRPENYNLELRINKYTEEVQGHVVITGEKIGNALKLHSKNLKIINVFVNGERKNIEEKDDVLEILDVENGAVKIEIKYTFKLTHNMEGGLSFHLSI